MSVWVGVGGDVNNLISLPDPPFVQVTQYIRERLYLVQIQMPSGLNNKVIVGVNFHRDRIAKLIAGILNFECG